MDKEKKKKLIARNGRETLTRSLLLALVKRPERNVGDLDDLETDTWNITDGVTLTTETGNQNLIVFLF
jgi:hypothetical protein